MTGRTAAALATTQRAGNTSTCFVNKLETNCSQFIPLYLLCTSILISVVLHGGDALKIALGKNVRSVQLASKSTNLRPGTQKTFGRKNTGVTPAMGICSILASSSEDSSENPNQSLYLPHFAAFVYTM